MPKSANDFTAFKEILAELRKKGDVSSLNINVDNWDPKVGLRFSVNFELVFPKKEGKDA